MAYGETKANFDAVIAELITALTEGGSPKSLPSLETDLQHGATSLGKFCQTVSDLLPSASGRKDVVADIVGRAVEPMIYAFRNHGAFTQVLLNALGKDALGKGVGLISMSDLTRYVSTHVISLTGGQ